MGTNLIQMLIRKPSFLDAYLVIIGELDDG